MANVAGLEKTMTNIQSEVSSLKVRADSAETKLKEMDTGLQQVANAEVEDLKTQSRMLIAMWIRRSALLETLFAILLSYVTLQTYSSSELCSGRDIRFPMESQSMRSIGVSMLGYGSSPEDNNQDNNIFCLGNSYENTIKIC